MELDETRVEYGILVENNKIEEKNTKQTRNTIENVNDIMILNFNNDNKKKK